MGELSTMMGAFSNELLQAVIHTVKTKTVEMERYKVLLTQRLVEAQTAIHRYEVLEKMQARQRSMTDRESQQRIIQDMDNLSSLSRAADSLVASYRQSSDDFQLQTAEETFQTAIINLYTLEHEIIDFLTSGLSATTTYAIYYDASHIPGMEGDASGEFFRGEISPEELKEFFNITENGTIQLRRSKSLIDKLQKNFQSDNKGTTKKYSTQDIWQKLTMAILGNLQQHLYDWMDKLKNLNQIAFKEHLGRKRYAPYVTLNQLFGFKNFEMKEQYAASTLAQVYKKYMLTWNQDYAGFSLRGLAYNRGHIAEAFERYLVHAGSQSLEPTDDDIIRYLNESVNDLPWFAGGDVGSTQVKALFGDIATVQIASANTICSLANELASLFLNPRGWEERARERINTKLQQGADKSEPQFQRVKQDIADNIGARLAEGLMNTYGIKRKQG